MPKCSARYDKRFSIVYFPIPKNYLRSIIIIRPYNNWQTDIMLDQMSVYVKKLFQISIASECIEPNTNSLSQFRIITKSVCSLLRLSNDRIGTELL